ncbi:MAG: stage II sporulation protein R [Acutalibacteraceae bacterium]|nr:stage II sporulation protein R [Acutalibacteraceae bacterium]
MSLFRKIELSLTIGIVTSIIFSVISFAQTSEHIRESVLRLHVIANSDVSVDQNLKLAVRDAIINESEEIFDGTVTVDNAVEKITPEINNIKEIAERVVENYGFDYNVDVSIDEEYFETRTYETVTLPAGKYLSLIVRIGEGKGKNWWCVMFPPMCVSAADEEDVLKTTLSEKEIKLVNSKPEYEPRFKIIELYEKFRNKICN